MAAPIGAELYLRLALEKSVVSGAQPNPMQGNDATLIARALVAAGTLEHEVAASVLEEYQAAMLLRWPSFAPFVQSPARSGRGSPPAGPAHRFVPARAATSEESFELGSSRISIELVRFGTDATTLRLSGVELDRAGRGRRGAAPSARAMARQAAAFGIGNPDAIEIRDDLGTTTTAHSRGGSGGDRSWEGSYRTDSPLSPSTAWIEIEGHRLQLSAPPATPPVVHVEPLAVAPDPMRALLYKELLAGSHPHAHFSSDIEAAVSALVATGSLAEDDPLISELEQAGADLGTNSSPRRSAAPVRRAAARRTTELPEPWASLTKRRDSADGPTFVMPLGAVGDLDEIALRFDLLVSGPHGFSLTIACSPAELAFGRQHHFRGFDLDESRLGWWASDDRGNGYRGMSADWSSSGDLGEGTIAFAPSLDPEASELRLVAAGRSEQVVVTIQQPGGARAGAAP